MCSTDPLRVLDWFWAHDLIEGCSVYDGRDRYRDAYHGSTHKARQRIGIGYLYNVDTDVTPERISVPADGLVVTLGHAATRALADDGYVADLAHAVGDVRVERAATRDDAIIIRAA